MYDLVPMYCAPLTSVAAITYRQDVFRDLENEALLDGIRDFGQQMQRVRDHLVHASKATFVIDQERWLLKAAGVFRLAVAQLGARVSEVDLRSAALTAFRDYLLAYLSSEEFGSLAADTDRLMSTIGRVRYRLRIDGPKVIVTRYQPQPDYSAEVLQTFARFRRGSHKEYPWGLERQGDMGHVEAAITDLVARLEPEAFQSLREYCDRHRQFLDPTIAQFDREAQFYVAYLDFMGRVTQSAGLGFCYPEVTDERDSIEMRDIFDLALVESLTPQATVVTNDIELHDGERVVVVSGPNQGGKTTLARAIGQVHHLARLGVPVPGEHVRLARVDEIFTHFERGEQVEDLTSKLEDDLGRIHAILEQATSSSLLIMNESFSSTTVRDQLFIGRRVMRQVLDCGMLCVLVTFLDELATLDQAIVSIVGAVHPDDLVHRTFKFVRRPPDGLAYATALAEKHRLTYSDLQARLAR